MVKQSKDDALKVVWERYIAQVIVIVALKLKLNKKAGRNNTKSCEWLENRLGWHEILQHVPFEGKNYNSAHDLAQHLGSNQIEQFRLKLLGRELLGVDTVHPLLESALAAADELIRLMAKGRVSKQVFDTICMRHLPAKTRKEIMESPYDRIELLYTVGMTKIVTTADSFKNENEGRSPGDLASETVKALKDKFEELDDEDMIDEEEDEPDGRTRFRETWDII